MFIVYPDGNAEIGDGFQFDPIKLYLQAQMAIIIIMQLTFTLDLEQIGH